MPFLRNALFAAVLLVSLRSRAESGTQFFVTPTLSASGGVIWMSDHYEDEAEVDQQSVTGGAALVRGGLWATWRNAGRPGLFGLQLNVGAVVGAGQRMHKGDCPSDCGNMPSWNWRSEQAFLGGNASLGFHFAVPLSGPPDDWNGLLIAINYEASLGPQNVTPFGVRVRFTLGHFTTASPQVNPFIDLSAGLSLTNESTSPYSYHSEQVVLLSASFGFELVPQLPEAR